MGFIEAISSVREGQSVRRDPWNDPKAFVKLYNKKLMLFKGEDNKYHDWIISEEDMFSEDWITTGVS